MPPLQHGGECLVLVNGDIAEAGHAAERLGEGGVDQAGAFEQSEGIGVALRHTKTLCRHDMHGHIDRRLAGPFDVKCKGIDMR